MVVGAPVVLIVRNRHIVGLVETMVATVYGPRYPSEIIERIHCSP